METLAIPRSDRGQLARLAFNASSVLDVQGHSAEHQPEDLTVSSPARSSADWPRATQSFLSCRSLCLLVHSCSRLQQRDVALPAWGRGGRWRARRHLQGAAAHAGRQGHGAGASSQRPWSYPSSMGRCTSGRSCLSSHPRPASRLFSA